MKKTRVKLIVKEFYKQMNPDMWDGSGERPDSFDTHAWEYPLTDAIEGNCGCGWDIECYCEDSVDAKRQLRTYQDNVGYPVRIKKWREKIV